MRWESVQRSGGRERAGVVQQTEAKDGTVYEIRLRYYESINRTRKAYSLWKAGKQVGEEQGDPMGCRALAAADAQEVNEPRTYDQTYLVKRDEVEQVMGRSEVIELLAGKPVKQMSTDEKLESASLMDHLWVRRGLTTWVGGQQVKIVEQEH